MGSYSRHSQESKTQRCHRRPNPAIRTCLPIRACSRRTHGIIDGLCGMERKQDDSPKESRGFQIPAAAAGNPPPNLSDQRFPRRHLNQHHTRDDLVRHSTEPSSFSEHRPVRWRNDLVVRIPLFLLCEPFQLCVLCDEKQRLWVLSQRRGRSQSCLRQTARV